MRHFAFSCLTISLILTSFCAMAKDVTKAPCRDSLTLEKGVTYTLGGDNKSHKSFTAPRHSAPLTDIITDPQGEEMFYEKESAGTFVLGNMMGMYKDSFPSTIIWGKDNDVYFKNLLSVFPGEYYLKGTREGNLIKMATNQTIEYYESEGYGINFGVFKTVPGVENGVDVVTFEYAPEIAEIQFTVNEKGELLMVLPGAPFDGEKPTEYVAALYFTDDYSFTGYCDFFQSYTPQDIQFISIPEGLEIKPYVYIDDHNYADVVEVASDDKYLYIRGLNSMLPEGTIRAKISGNKAVVAQNEYLGIYFDQYYILTKVFYDNPDFDENNEESLPLLPAPANIGFELTIDNDNRRIYADTEGVYLSFHCDETDIFNTLGFYSIFELKYQDTFEGTPSNPVNLEYHTEFAEWQGFNDFFFTLSNFSTEGMLLDPTYLYYKVFVDGEPLVFCQEEGYNLLNQKTLMYEGVPFEVELLPYDFNNNADIFKFTPNEFDLGIYLEGITTIGVQTVYFYNNVFTYSDIVTLNVETGETDVTPGQNGVGTSVCDSVASEVYYSLDGVRVDNPEKGIYIRVTRFSNGSFSTRKVMMK